jgi:hypothetical protein
MLYILPAVKMRENRAQPPQEPDTWRRELIPPAILSGHMDKKPQKPADSLHRAARPLPGAATEPHAKARINNIDSNLLFIGLSHHWLMIK